MVPVIPESARRSQEWENPGGREVTVEAVPAVKQVLPPLPPPLQ